MSEEDEIELGREAAAQVEQSMGFAGSAELNAYVTRIGQRLAKHSSRSHLDYEFHVVEGIGETKALSQSRKANS